MTAITKDKEALLKAVAGELARARKMPKKAVRDYEVSEEELLSVVATQDEAIRLAK